MKNRLCMVGAAFLLIALLLCAAGCSAKSNPAGAETMAIAKQFVNAVFVSQEADLAMSLTSGVETYGYVSRKAIESTIEDDTTKKCVTQADSVTVGKPGADFQAPEITSADQARGVTERVVWFVASNYSCAGSNAAPRTSVVVLDKAGEKWTVSKCLLYYGVDYWD